MDEKRTSQHVNLFRVKDDLRGREKYLQFLVGIADKGHVGCGDIIMP